MPVAAASSAPPPSSSSRPRPFSPLPRLSSPSAGPAVPVPIPVPVPVPVAELPVSADDRYESASAASAASAAVASSSRQGGSACDGIEMAPIAGHRRRKSSLMNPIGGPAHGHRTHPIIGATQEPHISENGAPARIGGPSRGPTRDDAADDGSSDEDVCDDEEMGLAGLDRARKQKKRRRNTRLDNRIAREKNLSADELREADKDVVKNLAVICLFIILWYIFSLAISLYNKWMFDKNNLNFAFPLFTTSFHMLVQFVLSATVLYFFPSLRPQNGHSSDGGRSRHETEPSKSNPVMTKLFYLTRIGPCGVSTGLDIGLGNASLKFISLTFYTMCKSSSLAFVLLFAFVFRLETPTWRLVAVIATMTAGVVFMVFGEVEFKLGGFVLVISAAFFSGFRWALTQILLLRNPATSNPFSSIFFLTPVMFVTLISLAVPVEGVGALWQGFKTLSDEWGVVATPLFLLFPGCIAFCMTASEFALLQRTSVVTLSIAGIFKEVVTISAASIVFGDKLTLVNFFGLITTMVAIVAYNYIKITKMRERAQQDAHGRKIGAHLGSPATNSGPESELDNDDSTEETAGLLRPGPSTMVTSDGDILQPNVSAPPDERRDRRPEQ